MGGQGGEPATPERGQETAEGWDGTGAGYPGTPELGAQQGPAAPTQSDAGAEGGVPPPGGDQPAAEGEFADYSQHPTGDYAPEGGAQEAGTGAEAAGYDPHGGYEQQEGYEPQEGYDDTQDAWNKYISDMQGQIASLTQQLTDKEAYHEGILAGLQEEREALERQLEAQAAPAPAADEAAAGGERLRELEAQLAEARGEAAALRQANEADQGRPAEAAHALEAQLEESREELTASKATIRQLESYIETLGSQSGGEAPASEELKAELHKSEEAVVQLQKTVAFITVKHTETQKEAEALREKLGDQEEAYVSLSNDMNDLLVCLGQESAKVQALTPLADKSGADVDAVLAAVEQEYGASPEDD